jgi:hypothetical protein
MSRWDFKQQINKVKIFHYVLKPYQNEICGGGHILATAVSKLLKLRFFMMQAQQSITRRS